MADARGAMALRQAAVEPELDVQVAVLAIHLQLYARVFFCRLHPQFTLILTAMLHDVYLL